MDDFVQFETDLGRPIFILKGTKVQVIETSELTAYDGDGFREKSTNTVCRVFFEGMVCPVYLKEEPEEVVEKLQSSI